MARFRTPALKLTTRVGLKAGAGGENPFTCACAKNLPRGKLRKAAKLGLLVRHRRTRLSFESLLAQTNLKPYSR